MQTTMDITPKNADRLVRKIHRNFPVLPMPAEDEIIEHECDECHALKDALAGLRWSDVPRAVLEIHYDQLSLLTAKAFHYYIPSYLSYSLQRVPPTDEHWVKDVPASLSTSDHQPIVDFTIYSLDFCSQERWNACGDHFNLPQATLIRNWLSFVICHAAHFDVDLQAAQRALSIWDRMVQARQV